MSSPSSVLYHFCHMCGIDLEEPAEFGSLPHGYAGNPYYRILCEDCELNLGYNTQEDEGEETESESDTE